jgi:hypothetical protein
MRILSLQHMQHSRFVFYNIQIEHLNKCLKRLKYLKHSVRHAAHGLLGDELRQIGEDDRERMEAALVGGRALEWQRRGPAEQGAAA